LLDILRLPLIVLIHAWHYEALFPLIAVNADDFARVDGVRAASCFPAADVAVMIDPRGLAGLSRHRFADAN
jgi:hypothetical protein